MYIHTFFVELSTGVLRTCIALYHVFFYMYIFMHMDALLHDVYARGCALWCLICLHVDAKFARMLGTWMPLVYFM